MSRGIIILVAVAAIIVAVLVALASIDTTVAPHAVQKDMAGPAAPAQ